MQEESMPAETMRQDPVDASLLVRDIPQPAGCVRILTLNRPARRNALDTVLLQLLLRELRRADTSAQSPVRAIVLSGAGSGFCAGGDVREFAGTSDPTKLMTARARLMADVLVALHRHALPVVAAIHGVALGGGVALALASDMVVAAPDAEFGFPEFRDSVVPAVVMPLLAQQVPSKLAFELLTSGSRIGASTAREAGLVNLVSAAERHVEEAMTIAEGWASAAPHVMRETKRLIQLARASTLENSLEAGIEVTAATWRPESER
jgi:enoyl-CoA hydratase/carnithine racemase